MIISERIYKIMEEKGISQKEFCMRTGIAQSTVSDWKHKKINPNADKIVVICEALEITPYELLLGDSQESNENADYMIYTGKEEDFNIVECYQSLNQYDKCRIIGYMQALKDIRK